MKTKSVWGNPPKRIYNIMRKLESEKDKLQVCIVGCSDGKFVMPFARKGHHVTGYEIDDIALYGGKKVFPVPRKSIEKKKYIPSDTKPKFRELESEEKEIQGLIKRLNIEKLKDSVTIIKDDFYRSNTEKEFDLIFTSCSIQYKTNRDLGLETMLNKLKQPVKVGGYLYMDYMMPLEDRHDWKSELFLRTGQIYNYFDKNMWEIVYCKELKEPVFEAAHADRPSDHFHRFGYVLARRLKYEE